MQKHTSRGFTLIELLVVIAIIALLIGILLPALAKARLASQKLLGAANHRSMAQATALYADQFDEWTPAGHEGEEGSRWAWTWTGQLRFAMGGDEKSQDAFLNPGAGKDFDVVWEKFHNTTRFGAGNQNSLMDYGFEEDELPPRHNPRGGDKSQIGTYALSVGWNELGCAPLFTEVPNYNGPSPTPYLVYGMGTHTLSKEAYSGGSAAYARADMGPKLAAIQQPADMIVTGDTFVDLDNDGWITPFPNGHTANQGANAELGQYFSGQANVSFMDGHAESISAKDYTLTDDVIDAGIGQNDPQVKSRISRWNNTAKPHTEHWNG